MQFQVPQFIEHDPKILGPLTLKQSLYVGAALAASFFCYLYFGKSSFPLFVLTSGGFFAVSMAFAFYKIEGLPLLTVIKNFFSFSTKSKQFIWDRKETPVFVSGKKKETKQKVEENPYAGMKKEGRIEELSKKLDFGK